LRKRSRSCVSALGIELESDFCETYRDTAQAPVYEMRVQSDPSAPPRMSSFPSVPSDPVAAREFLQARVSMYTGVALAIWGVALLSDRIITTISFGSPFAGHNAWYDYAHYAAIAVLAVSYGVTKVRSVIGYSQERRRSLAERSWRSVRPTFTRNRNRLRPV
jgi:hypothetical protein